MIFNVAGGHALGVKPEDLLVEPRNAPLMFADQLRLERAVAITWRLNRNSLASISSP